MEKTEEMTRRNLPESLAAYAANDPARFHAPGHKGRGMGGFWRGDLIGWDVADAAAKDGLRADGEAVTHTQEMIAAAYGASQAYVSVNGATAALQAMILALAPDERLLMYRDAHKSAILSAARSGIQTDFIEPAWNAAQDLYGMADAETLDAALTRTGATAVLVTSPNCLGMCANLPELSRTAHAHGALLLVDATHGAHFPFSELLPDVPAGYADLWVHAAYKTLNALAQAASLQLADCRIDPARVRRALNAVQTDSPSYLLTASLDWSIFMARRQNWSEQVLRSRRLAARISAVRGLSVLDLKGDGCCAQDATRITVDVSGRGLTGYSAQSMLADAGVYPDTADARRIVLLTTPSDDPAWYGRLIQALDALPEGESGSRTAALMPVAGECRLTLREAVLARQRLVPLERAAGCTAGEPFGLYPPGAARCLPGEAVRTETAQAILLAAAQGARTFGVYDGCISAVEE